MADDKLREEIAYAEKMKEELEAKQTAATAKWSEFEAAGTTGTEEGQALYRALLAAGRY